MKFEGVPKSAGKIEEVLVQKIEKEVEERSLDAGGVVDLLIQDFPSELHERLFAEIEHFDDQAASDYLITKLVERKRALVSREMRSLPQDIMVTHECPIAIMESLERSVDASDKDYLGSGMNGKVTASARQERACYKVLYPERVKILKLNIVREAVMQHEAWKLLNDRDDVAQVPHVLAFIDHPQAKAIMMEKVNGSSLLEILESKAELPETFDIDVFFEKLHQAVLLLNQHGYFHRDLTNNAGNVMVDTVGNPWIIDFGSAIKSLDQDEDTRFYQITAGGSKMLAHDQSGVQTLKKRLKDHLVRKESK